MQKGLAFLNVSQLMRGGMEAVSMIVLSQKIDPSFTYQLNTLHLRQKKVMATSPKSVCSAGHNYPLLFSGGQPDNQSHLGIRDGKQILILDDDENTLRGILRKDSVQRESPYAQAKHWLGNIAPWC